MLDVVVVVVAAAAAAVRVAVAVAAATVDVCSIVVWLFAGLSAFPVRVC